MTVDSIRDDLEHIHRLEIVDLKIKDGHAWISTNGVNWAVVASTCMQSRLKYKASKIEFYPDDCDQPLPTIVKKQYKRRGNSPKKFATIPHANRFAPLNGGMDEEDDAHTDAARRTVSSGDAFAV